jgi:uncharacterized SAM-binding protein YcdF (DUF218 family)
MKSLLLPPGIILVLALVAVLIRRRRPFSSKVIVASCFLFLYALSTPALSGALLGSLQWYEPLELSSAAGRSAEVIVVLSGDRRRGDGEGRPDDLGPLTLERVAHAARLKKVLDLPLLVSGGSLEEGLLPLAELMATALRDDFGVAANFLEARSHNTEFNARLSARILKSNRVGSVVLVTHAWHMPRAKSSFERHGLEVIPAPAAFMWQSEGATLGDWIPQADALQESSFAMHEWIGLAWYWFRYDLLGS